MNLDKMLRTDFSREARHKQETLDELLKTLENGNRAEHEHERVSMLMKKRKIAGVLVASLTLLLSMTTFAYGGEILRVIKEITVGNHAKFVVAEQTSTLAIPTGLEGKLFDENGNVLTAFPEDDSPIYTESGEKIDHLTNKIWADESGEHVELAIVTETEAQRNDEKVFTSTSSKEEARQYTMFDFKTPSYLPAGYEQITYKMFNGEDGQPSPECKYLTVEYKNTDGDMIYCQMRYMDDETAFVASAGSDIDKMNINGYEAAISEAGVDIEIDGIMYMFMNGTIGHDEFVKIASSLQ